MTDTWSDMKLVVAKLADNVRKIPPPPAPDDTWGEKMNTLNRTVHTMQEHVDSRIEAEDAQTAVGEEE